jgi:hypothetical protein
MNTLETWQVALTALWDKERAERLIALAESRYASLKRDAPRPDHPRLGRHLDEFILPGLALYQELLATGKTVDESLDIVRASVAASAEPERRRMAAVSRVPLFFLVWRLGVRGHMNRNFPPAGWETEWVELSSTRIAFNTRRCFYLDTLSRRHAPELTRVFCDYDDVVFNSLSPRIRWRRTQTLARGGELCDFCFERAGKDIGAGP